MEKRSCDTDVICLGQAVVDCITRAMEKAPEEKLAIRAEKIGLSTGGDAVNESFVLAQLGYKVKLVCGLGNDLAGMILRQEAQRFGVDTGRIRIIDGMDTPVANLMVAVDGSRRSVNSRATMLEKYLPEENDVKGAKIVSFASLFRAPLDQKDVIIRLLRSAYEDGAVICADTKLPTFRQLSLEDLKEVLPMISYLFPNEKEAAFYTGQTQFEEMAKVFHDYGIPNVIIKTGPDGCFVSTQEENFSLPAHQVKVVDTTGAGDNFVAGFISGLLKGEDLRACSKRALLQAAENVQHMGAVWKK